MSDAINEIIKGIETVEAYLKFYRAVQEVAGGLPILDLAAWLQSLSPEELEGVAKAVAEKLNT